MLIQETIRKALKKRQENAQRMLGSSHCRSARDCQCLAQAISFPAANQRKTPGMHDTHLQYQKLPRVTPAELSRKKAEQDAAHLAELQKVRARQEEANAKNIPRVPGAPVSRHWMFIEGHCTNR